MARHSKIPFTRVFLPGMKNAHLSACLFALATCWLMTPKVSPAADPSTDDVNQPLMAHDSIPGAKQKITVMYERFAEWEKLAISSTELANAGKRFPHQKLSQTYPDLFRGVWYAKQLQAMGEPAGYDLENKFTQLKLAYNIFASRLREFQQKEIIKLRKDDKRRAETIARASKLANEGKYAEAEKLIQAFHLKQLSSIFYLTQTQASPFETPVNPLHMQILDSLIAQQLKENAEVASEKSNLAASASEQLQTESARLIEALKSSPQVTLQEGKTGDAADAVRYLSDLWAKASVANTRGTAVSWAFSQGPTSIEDALGTQVEATETQVAQAISRLLQSATQSTPPEQMGKLVSRLMIEIALIRRQCSGDWGKELVAELEKLSAGNAAFAGQTQSYQAAVAEPMRWMGRFARQRASLLAKGYPTSSTLLGAKFTPPASSRPSIYKAAGTRERVLTPDTLTLPASWMVADSKALVGKKIQTEASLRVSPNAPIAVVTENGRVYANINVQFDVASEIRAMEEMLLVDPSHPALSLAAADAVSSARRHEFVAAGGTVQRLTAEPLVSRLAALPDLLHVLVPLNRSPAKPENGRLVQKVLWRVDVRCDWVSHPLFAAPVGTSGGIAQLR